MVFSKSVEVVGFYLGIIIVLILVGHMTGTKKEGSHRPEIAKDQHPACKTSDMFHSDIVSNGVLHKKHKNANFTFLGRVGNMKECLGLCCSNKKCDLAYLVNNTKCFSTQCSNPGLCKIVRNEKTRPQDVKMSLMVRDEATKRVYITAYIIMALMTFGAALSGTVWIASVFVKKYKQNKEKGEERMELAKQPQVY